MLEIFKGQITYETLVSLPLKIAYRLRDTRIKRLLDEKKNADAAEQSIKSQNFRKDFMNPKAAMQNAAFKKGR